MNWKALSGIGFAQRSNVSKTLSNPKPQVNLKFMSERELLGSIRFCEVKTVGMVKIDDFLVRKSRLQYPV